MASDSDTTSQLSPKRYLRTLDSGASPNKRRKALIETPNSPSSSSSSKGKDRVCHGSEMVDSGSQSCGICLSEEGNAIRGWIDSCDHYFCFVCIMEWAKVESRCPMCKRRFSAIRRPPKKGLFLSERVVNVPVRDQVYHYFGNATLGLPDPYSEVRCTVCDNNTDESLLLLCDLCDSAAHTYCVGLGATVPEGDWFCEDCTVSKAEHNKNEPDADCNSEASSENFCPRSQAETHVSVLEIVQENSFREGHRPFTALSLTPIVPERRMSHADSMTTHNSRMHQTISPTVTRLDARTLRSCRNVHGRIQALRENWNAIRSGSLRFASNSVDASGNTDQRRNSLASLRDGSHQPRSTPCSSQTLAVQKGSSCNMVPSRNSYDEDKAWKMMDVAKSMQQARERTSIVYQNSKHPLSKVHNPTKKANTNANLLASSKNLLGTTNLTNTGPEKDNQCHSHIKVHGRHEPRMLAKQKPKIVPAERIMKFGECSSSGQLSGKHELPSFRKVETSVNVDVCHGFGGQLSEQDLLSTSRDVCTSHNGPVCFISPVESVTADSNASCAKLEMSSSSQTELSRKEAMMEKTCAGSKSKRNDDAKSEIQSLVKRNLKLLSRERKLGVGSFKKIAWLSTHSILAACGLEQPKPGGRSFSSNICCHTNNLVQQNQMSTLMPSSCGDCFRVFVKDVVETIMSEKLGGVKMPSQ